MATRRSSPHASTRSLRSPHGGKPRRDHDIHAFRLPRRCRRSIRPSALVNPRRGNIGSDWNFALHGQRTRAALHDCPSGRQLRADYLARMTEAIAGTSDPAIAFSDFVETHRAGPASAPPEPPGEALPYPSRFRPRNVIRRLGTKRRLLEWGNPLCCPSVVLNRAALRLQVHRGYAQQPRLGSLAATGRGRRRFRLCSRAARGATSARRAKPRR